MFEKSTFEPCRAKSGECGVDCASSNFLNLFAHSTSLACSSDTPATEQQTSMHHIEDCNLCGVDWCKKVDQGVCVNFSLNDGTHALGPGISEVGCDALEDTTPYCIDGSDAIYGVGKPR